MTTTANASGKPYEIDWHGEPRTLTTLQANIVAELGMTDFPPLADRGE